MYRIRFHGRGGQGIKTASRILGSAFFAEGFEVQDAPRYGAERRGAPILAYVRADRSPVTERGSIEWPDLVVVADESLVQVPAAEVMKGLRDSTVLVIASSEGPEEWRERLAVSGRILTLPPHAEEDAAQMGAATVGAAARLIGKISQESLEQAIRLELAGLSPSVVERNALRARQSFASFEAHAGCVVEGEVASRAGAVPPEWVTLEAEASDIAAPDIHAGATSERVPTGLWRTMRPVIDETLCNRCSWICSTLCPDGAIDVGANREPRIDYDHCKGCLLCAAVCPPHAIRVEPETGAHPVRRES
jgi:pyruvate ferredoxin oxidoreductase gamma subunit